MPTALLPGRYKGTRKKHPAPVLITIECPGCGWKSRQAKPEFAEKSYVAHLDVVHYGPLECAFCDDTIPRSVRFCPDFNTLAQHVQGFHPNRAIAGDPEAIPPYAFNFGDGEMRHHVSSLNGGNDMPLQRPIVPGTAAVPGGKSAGNWLRDEDVTDKLQVVKIMDARPDVSGRSAVIVKLQMANGQMRLDSLKANNPNFSILFNAFGEDEKAWAGRYVNLFLEFDKFTERNWRRYSVVAEDKVATAKK